MLLSLCAPAISVRRAVISDARDEAAFRRVVATQDRSYWPGWEEQRQLSVRWNTWADVAILIAVDEQQPDLKIVGTAEIIGPLEASHPLPRRCLLRDVWVDANYRRRGIARRMIGAAEALAGELGEQCVSLEVKGDNDPAVSLYKSLGYTECGGDSPGDFLLSPFAPMIKKAPGWMRGTLVLVKEM